MLSFLSCFGCGTLPQQYKRKVIHSFDPYSINIFSLVFLSAWPGHWKLTEMYCSSFWIRDAKAVSIMFLKGWYFLDISKMTKSEGGGNFKESGLLGGVLLPGGMPLTVIRKVLSLLSLCPQSLLLHHRGRQDVLYCCRHKNNKANQLKERALKIVSPNKSFLLLNWGIRFFSYPLQWQKVAQNDTSPLFLLHIFFKRYLLLSSWDSSGLSLVFITFLGE